MGKVITDTHTGTAVPDTTILTDNGEIVYKNNVFPLLPGIKLDKEDEQYIQKAMTMTTAIIAFLVEQFCTTGEGDITQACNFAMKEFLDGFKS